MRRIIATILAIGVVCAQTLDAQGNSWNKIRYSGGTVEAKVDPFDWNTTMTVTPDTITLELGRKQTLKIAPAQVTKLSYGQEAHRRVAEMVALSVVVTPLALFGLLHKSRKHFVGIEYKTPDGKTGGLLLEADKNNYRAILHALKAVTGQSVENAP